MATTFFLIPRPTPSKNTRRFPGVFYNTSTINYERHMDKSSANESSRSPQIGAQSSSGRRRWWKLILYMLGVALVAYCACDGVFSLMLTKAESEYTTAEILYGTTLETATRVSSLPSSAFPNRTVWTETRRQNPFPTQSRIWYPTDGGSPSFLMWETIATYRQVRADTVQMQQDSEDLSNYSAVVLTYVRTD